VSDLLQHLSDSLSSVPTTAVAAASVLNVSLPARLNVAAASVLLLCSEEKRSPSPSPVSSPLPPTKGLPSDYQAFIHTSRYARWVEAKQRRETWPETISR
jgi:hypothetical protein